MTTERKEDVSFPIVGVGASAGGLEALREMLAGHRDGVGLAIIIVQHLDPNHESMMAQLIERYTSMPVRQIEGGERVEPGCVYVIPPGFGLSIRDRVLTLNDFTEPRGLRRPIDDFFERLAEDQRENAACVILSGTGADGSRGLRAIKEYGGFALAQDPDDARYDGMPLAAAGTGLVDHVKPARDLLAALTAFFSSDRTGGRGVATGETVADFIDDLCRTVTDETGHDFSGYKRTTLGRRIERRMQVLGMVEAADYAKYIRGNGDECRTLLREFLINVTRFFRDPEAFDLLRERAILPLVRETGEGEEIRIWVAGCSSGEEAYTIAMLFRDAMETLNNFPLVSIFASDIDEQMLRIAREAQYPLSALADIPEDFREKYTLSAGDHFAMRNSIRDMVRFSVHSVIKDPPFSKIDLISTRNLLIYFDDRLQRAALPLFHYALRPDGYLFLGLSETIGRFDDLFDDIDHSSRLFRRRSVRPNYPLELPATMARRRERTPRVYRPGDGRDLLESDALDQLMLRYAPASLLVDSTGIILASWGPIGRYFDFPVGGDRRLHAPQLAKAGLRNILGPLIRQTVEDKQPHVVRDVEVRADFGVQEARVICEPVRDGSMLVVIRETGAFQARDEDDFVDLSDSDNQVQLLENELRVVRHRLRTTVEELETANEELKSSNEEMMSMNEELQSTNEELTTVNDELKLKVDQLTIANDDLKNFFDSTQLAVIVVDQNMIVRSFTGAATALFPFQPTDRGRSLADVASPLRAHGYLDLARQVARTGEALDRAMRDEEKGRDYAVRIIPYRRLDGTADGATLIFTDVTKALALERTLADEREQLELAVSVAGIGIWTYRPDTHETHIDAAERALFGLSPDDPVEIADLMNRIHPEDRTRIEHSLQQLDGQGGDYNETFRVEDGTGGYRWMRGMGRYLARADGSRIIGVTYDVSAEYQILNERELHLAEMNHRIKNLFAVVGAIISNSEREAASAEEFSRILRDRVSALARAHSLMLHTSMQQPLGLGPMLERVLTPLLGGQALELDGPELAVPVKQLTPFVLVFHELATNSAKYGALSWDRGQLSVRWSEADGIWSIRWVEVTSAQEFQEETSGFGSRLIKAALLQIGATMETAFAGGTLTMLITLPAPK